MKTRAVAPMLGIYQDFRTVIAPAGQPSEPLVRAAKDADARVVFFDKEGSLSGIHEGVLFMKLGEQHPQFADNTAAGIEAKDRRGLNNKFKDYPDEVFAVAGAELSDNVAAGFRHKSVHVLANKLAEADIRASIEAGHFYFAHDWLCDPAGFSVVAENNLGVFEIGDRVPLSPGTTLQARFPVAAKVKLMRGDEAMAESEGAKFIYEIKEPGAYRLEAALTVDGEDLPWIRSNVLQVEKAPNLALPIFKAPPTVEVRPDISYIDDGNGKHKLDLFLPRDKANYPVMMFVHGGSWRTGDRKLYTILGYKFAKMGIGVAIPSYRLMPAAKHPAQIDDVAAAFAWVYKNVQATGFYLAGHSAGGHLVSLLALDSEYLERYKIPAAAVKGVVSMSGVYDVSHVSAFVAEPNSREGSPLTYVHRQAPPFLVTYCQWDYLGLPQQARDFAAALKKDFVGVQLVYVPGKGHITEMLDIWQDDDPSARAILSFVQ